LFVDDFLLDRREKVELRLHSPTPREVVSDQPPVLALNRWAGSGASTPQSPRWGLATRNRGLIHRRAIRPHLAQSR
jgi:hypothetical protein